MLTFVEDERFIRAAARLLTEDECFELMIKLSTSPEAGNVIPGSGGCRKLRFAAKGKGSRGGARVIYFFRSQAEQILLLYLYAMNEKADLSANEIKRLKFQVKS